MRKFCLFIFVGGILASCIDISPTPKTRNISFEQRKCISFYETFAIKSCDYEEDKDLCYKVYLSGMAGLINKNCGIDITN